MSIHHLNCGSFSPYIPRIRGVLYCLLIETSAGLVLVDTGFGTPDYTHPTPLVRSFMTLLHMRGDIQETAVRQITRRGFDPEDVQHIVLTHLHLDHAGGLPDFPKAQVHVHHQEFAATQHPQGFMERFYVNAHWKHGPRWVLHREATPSAWFGFDSINVLPECSPQILLIPLPGHTRGHCGVAIETPDGWLLHCGDAISPFHKSADANQNAPNPGWLVRAILGDQVPRLRKLAQEHGQQIELISGHDSAGLQRHLKQR